MQSLEELRGAHYSAGGGDRRCLESFKEGFRLNQMEGRLPRWETEWRPRSADG